MNFGETEKEHNHNQHNSFIPSYNNDSQKDKDYLNLWKDFRNDIRKKCSIGGAPLSTRSNNRDTSSDRVMKSNNKSNILTS